MKVVGCHVGGSSTLLLVGCHEVCSFVAWNDI